MKEQIKSSQEEAFVSNKDLSLYVPQRCLLTTAAHIEADMHKDEATFDLYVREFPKNRSYLIFVGLEDVINYLLNFKFSESDLDLIKKQFNLSEKVMDYLRNFKFSGDVFAMKEGTIFFPNEPIIRITAPLAQLQIIESFLFNTVGFQSLIASKVSRLVNAAKPFAVGIGESRAHGLEAGLKAIRAGYIVGTNSSPLLLSFKRYGLPSVGGIATHFFITSFPSEKEAFKAYLRTDPEGSVMVDTYDFEQGVKTLIEVAKEIEKEGRKVKWITIDSGDLLERYLLARGMLDSAGLNYIGITAVSNLDEFKIKELVSKGANYNLFGAATEIVTSADCPKIEIVYKLAEIKKNGEWKPKAKFSPGKLSYPGRKQVFRVIKNGLFVKDIIGLDSETHGKKLLVPVIIKGDLIESLPSLKQIREYTQGQYEQFPKGLFNIDSFFNYPIEISEKIKQMVVELMEEYSVK
jgi:nicotinate phosphoribosyltransferase